MKLYFNFGIRFAEWVWDAYLDQEDDSKLTNILEQMDKFNIATIPDALRLMFFNNISEIQTKQL